VTETSGDTYTERTVAGETFFGSPEEILTSVQVAFDPHDPDILVCLTSEIILTLFEMTRPLASTKCS
jgi:DNA polymerase I